MDGRKALLKRLASVTDWDQTTRAAFAGECWVETRNTIYRFRDGVCFQVANRDPRKKGRASALVGMRLVGWVSETRSESEREWHSRLGYEWTEGAAALLWRPQGEAGDEAMAMTSRTTAFTAGRSSSCLQAMHDQAPPPDSQLLRRVVASSPPFAAGRPPMPSHVSG